VKSIKSISSARDLIDSFASSGRYSFSSQEARAALGVSADASKLALNRLTHQGFIASPGRGFYVIVPPEYRELGCLPPDHFIPDLMQHYQLTYYAGLLSAAQFHGAAHLRPQEFQVFVARNRRPIRCGDVRVKFFARKHIVNVAVQDFNTPRGALRVSTPEATAVDLVGYPNSAGGLDQVTTVIAELAEVIDPELLVRAAKTSPITWAQRLGYILEHVGYESVSDELKRYVTANAREYTLLVTGSRNVEGDRNSQWKIVVNEDLDSDI